VTSAEGLPILRCTVRLYDSTISGKTSIYVNRVFQKFLKENDVHFFTMYNDETKASIVERFNRTLKTKMWKYFTHRETLTYMDVLPDMVESYNRTVHRSIEMPPGRSHAVESDDSSEKTVRTKRI
jgi:hypothetical protein